jgi:hypothetical protein
MHGLFIALTVFLAGCSGGVNQGTNVTEINLQSQYQAQCSAGKCPCSSPVGLIVDGGTATAFTVNQVSCNQSCSDHQVLLTCQNGQFFKQGVAQNISQLSFGCQAQACATCLLGQNQVTPGSVVTMYSQSTAQCGQNCQSFSRNLTCVNGHFQGSLTGPSQDGKDNLYSLATCVPTGCHCNLPNGGTLSVNGSLTFYQAATGTCQSNCTNANNSISRTCVNSGTTANPIFSLNGDPTYSSLTCSGPTPKSCSCTLPDHKTVIGQGQMAILYSQNTEANCNTCTSPQSQMKVYCDSGVLYNAPISATTRQPISPTTLTTFQYTTCDTSPVDCFINQICVANGKNATLYSTSSLQCGQSLTSVSAVFSCSSGAAFKNNLPYIPTADTNASTWTANVPPNACSTGCQTPWKATVSTGTVITAYYSSGTSSNTCGVGCKSYQFTCLAGSGGASPSWSANDPTAPPGIAATSNNPYAQTCNNGCTQEGGGAPPRFCLLPWQNSYVSTDVPIPMWNVKIAYCGDSCQNHFKVGKCQLATGQFDAGYNFIYQSCTELPCRDLTLSAISPTFLSPKGGSLTVTGTGFTSSVAISVTGSSGTSYPCSVQSISSSKITCSLPAGVGSNLTVVAKVGPQTAVLPSAFSYYSGTCTQGPGIAVFKATGAVQNFVVPAGCNSLLAKAWGAGGGGRVSNIDYASLQFGGSGGYATGVINVAPGSTISVVVGQGGGASATYGGAAGGGLSGLFLSPTPSASSAILIAGGGGGAGDGKGCNLGGTGGEGGGANGGNHGSCSGGGASQSAGGTSGGAGANPGLALLGGGSSSSANPVLASYGGGGSSANSAPAGGGGGGGYYGGGSGAVTTGLQGAGGGGSGYANSTLVKTSTLTQGSGQVPANQLDPNYINGVGMGGTKAYSNSGQGGSGLVVIQY